jgi:hypothetical protein
MLMDPTWSFEAFDGLQGAVNAGLSAAKTDELSPAIIPVTMWSWSARSIDVKQWTR